MLRFLPEYLRIKSRDIRERARAVRASASFHPPASLLDQQFLRYANYTRLASVLSERFGSGSGVRALELGGSNRVIVGMLPDWSYEIAPSFPEVDVQDLGGYAEAAYDVVILDQVLEHVPDAERAVAEVLRVLRPGGICIATTPFLIEVHGYPNDYRRLTADGLRSLFARYGRTEVFSWGNRFSVRVISRHGWITSRNARRLLSVALWNEPDWPIDFLTLAWKRTEGASAADAGA